MAKRRPLSSQLVRNARAEMDGSDPDELVGAVPLNMLENLLDIWTLFRRVVPVSTKRQMFAEYELVFTGAEAVDALLNSRLVRTREDAVAVAVRMFDAGAFYHVTRDYEFKDTSHLYRFFEDDTVLFAKLQARHAAAAAAAAAADSDFDTGSTPPPGNVSVAAPPVLSLFSSTAVPASDPANYKVDLCKEATRCFCSVPTRVSSSFLAKWNAFAACVTVRNVRRSLFKIWEGVFVGDETVSRLVHSGLMPTREAAVAVGRELIAAGLFHHVTFARDFEDSKQLYRSMLLAPGPSLSLTAGRDVDVLAATIATTVRSLAEVDVRLLERDFRAGVPVHAEKRWMLRTYRNIFIGSEAVEFLFNWMAEHGYEPSVVGAEALGQTLFKRGVFRHVADDHAFFNDFLFYTLIDAPGPSAAAPCTPVAAPESPTTRLRYKCPFPGCAATADAVTFTSAARLDAHLLAAHGPSIPTDGVCEVLLIAVHALEPLDSADRAKGFARREVSQDALMTNALVAVVATRDTVICFGSSLRDSGFAQPRVNAQRLRVVEAEYAAATPISKLDLVASLRFTPTAASPAMAIPSVSQGSSEDGGARSPGSLLAEILDR